MADRTIADRRCWFYRLGESPKILFSHRSNNSLQILLGLANRHLLSKPLLNHPEIAAKGSARYRNHSTNVHPVIKNVASRPPQTRIALFRHIIKFNVIFHRFEHRYRRHTPQHHLASLSEGVLQHLVVVPDNAKADAISATNRGTVDKQANNHNHARACGALPLAFA